MSIHARVRKLKAKIRYEGTFLGWHVPTALRAEIFGIPKVAQAFADSTDSEQNFSRKSTVDSFFLSAWK